MYATLDPTLCLGCRLCVGTCPEVFYMDGQIANCIRTEIPTELSAKVLECANSCPIRAIHLEGRMEP